MKRFQTAALAALMCVAGVATVTAEETPDHPGHVLIDFRTLSESGEPAATIRITPSLVRFFASMASEAAAEIAELKGVQEIINQLREARVVVYEDLSGNEVGLSLQREIDQLKNKGWEEIVQARDDVDRINVLILPANDLIVGIVILATDDVEMAFVNITGDFNPETLGKHFGALAKQLNSGKIKLKDLDKIDLEEIVEEIIK